MPDGEQPSTAAFATLDPPPPYQIVSRIPTYKLSLGCPVLDGSLSGGVPCGSITEIVGESASGKTQLCLQLALISATGYGVSLYIHSEHPFPLRRLLRISNSSSNQLLLDRVLVSGAFSAHELLALLSRADKLTIPIGLIVVDSIAALFRADFDATPSDLRNRSALFFRISAELRRLAARHNAAVVVTNQVVDFVCNHSSSSLKFNSSVGKVLWSSGRRVSPALGIAWSNCVNTRLFLSRREEVEGDEGDNCLGRTRRRMEVVFAPHLPETAACDFVITADGLFGIDRIT